MADTVDEGLGQFEVVWGEPIGMRVEAIDQVGLVVVGRLLGGGHGLSRFQRIHRIRVAQVEGVPVRGGYIAGSIMDFWGCSALDALLSIVEPGTLVKIVFKKRGGGSETFWDVRVAVARL